MSKLFIDINVVFIGCWYYISFFFIISPYNNIDIDINIIIYIIL